jgi:hypothetical protein
VLKHARRLCRIRGRQSGHLPLRNGFNCWNFTDFHGALHFASSTARSALNRPRLSAAASHALAILSAIILPMMACPKTAEIRPG